MYKSFKAVLKSVTKKYKEPSFIFILCSYVVSVMYLGAIMFADITVITK